MSPARPQSLAARAGRWSAKHRKKAIFGWLAFVLVAVVAGTAAGTIQIADNADGNGESGRADRTLSQAFPSGASEKVLIQDERLTARDPRFRAAVDDVTRRLHRTPYVRDVSSPLDRGNAGRLAPDGHSALVEFEIAGSDDETSSRVDATLAATSAAQKAHPALRIEQFGDASAHKALAGSLDKDFARAETLSIPITLLILVVAFGALVAAGVPLLLALSGVGATIGLVGLVSHISPVDGAINSVILLVGLAVGVDYSLFYLRREREERRRGASPGEALATAAATSGRAVLVSGFTVMIAMAGMYFTGSSTFSSFATGTILVVAVSMIGSLTVLPALMAWLGDRVDKGRVPLIGGRRRAGGESRVLGALLDRVLRRPAIAALVSGGLLVALAIPAFGLHTAEPGIDSTPRDLPVMKTYQRIEKAFPGGPAPAEIAVSAQDVTAPPVRSAIADLHRRAIASGKIHEPVTVSVSSDRHVANVSLVLDGNGTDGRSQRALDTLRGTLIPQTLDTVPGVRADVAGEAAGTRDFNDLMKSHAPYVFAFVLSLAFALLLVTFRSIVIPIKAIVLNLLSVGAAYGLLVLVFQDGHGQGLLGFRSTGAITSWLPLFLFVILFGLSMDYHVFILSRIREAYDRGMSTGDAVAHGIRQTAGTVTSAAVVMVAVFAIFATLSSLEFKQMGVGLAAAILIDATIVRAVLLPATMRLLGRWNWYLPKRLEWLPRLRGEGTPEPARA